MTIVSAHTDRQARTLTFVAEYDAGVERVWQVWTDPGQLARWWAPPGWSTVVEPHDVVPGGGSEWRATGPEGEEGLGWWRTTAVDPPFRLEFDETFAGEGLEPLDDLDPTHTVVTIEPVGTGTRMTTSFTVPDLGQFDQMLAMGMAEGVRLSMEQIDAVLAEPAR